MVNLVHAQSRRPSKIRILEKTNDLWFRSHHYLWTLLSFQQLDCCLLLFVPVYLGSFALDFAPGYAPDCGTTFCGEHIPWIWENRNPFIAPLLPSSQRDRRRAALSH